MMHHLHRNKRILLQSTRVLLSSSSSSSSSVRLYHKSTQPLSSSGDDSPFRSAFVGQSGTIKWETGADAVRLLKRESARRNKSHAEWRQAAEEVLDSLTPAFDRDPELVWIFKVLLEPERVIQFRVPWSDDEGNLRFNRGFRVQYSSALGPYKGGLRFHPTVNSSVIRFLGFEQIFKNALTGLPLGGGKGGADFNPKGKSEAEILRFCQSFMSELHRYIGPHTDVPAGDIGVGGKEIGYLFGQYKRITQRFDGVLTGKGMLWGGSRIRPEATGYGCVYFAEEAVKLVMDRSMHGLSCTVSGAGNVAQYTAEKLLELGATVTTFSDSSGTVHKKDGFTHDNIAHLIKQHGEVRGYRVSQLAEEVSGAEFHANTRPWAFPCDLAFPSATQNELDSQDAKTLVENNCKGVFEGANMPCTPTAIEIFHEHKVVFGPAKAANAGGVATSGLEMSQNAQLATWSREEVDSKLQNIMKHVFTQCVDTANEYGLKNDLQAGANIAGFLRVAQAMKDQGAV